MTAHRKIMNNLATAIAASQDVRDFCIANFGRGLDVHVGAYAQCVPNEKDSPFCWLTPKEENEAVKEDDLFTVRVVVGGCVKGSKGEKVITNVITPRTDTANGLTLNGGNEVVENLRDLILVLARNTQSGAIVNRIRREENDIAHFPLEWCVFYMEYLEPDSLSSYLNPPEPEPEETNNSQEIEVQNG